MSLINVMISIYNLQFIIEILCLQVQALTIVCLCKKNQTQDEYSDESTFCVDKNQQDVSVQLLSRAMKNNRLESI